MSINNDNNKRLKVIIKELKRQKYTQRQLAKNLGINETALNNYNAGRVAIPDTVFNSLVAEAVKILPTLTDTLKSDPELLELDAIPTEKLVAELKRRGFAVTLSVT